MILLVENDTISRNAFARLLRAQGHQVVEVTDGQEALEFLPKDNFDLVIADLVMPRVNGLELAAQIRRHWPVMPILLMSAYLSQNGAKIISDGVVEFIQKPIDPPVLIATVQRLLQKPAA
jgi:CheY-like chemotaxis protein